MNKCLICLFLFIGAGALIAQTHQEYNRKGVDYGKQNKYDDAIREFKKSLRISNRSSAKTLHNLAWALELTGRIREAIKHYRDAVRRNPRQLPSLERLGFLYYKSGKYVKAVKYGEKVIELDPTNSTVIEWLPDAYRKKLGVNMKDNIRKRIERLQQRRGQKAEKKEADYIKEKKMDKKGAATIPDSYMQDFILKVGYVPLFRTELKDANGGASPRYDCSGFALKGEANVFLKGPWIGFGIEWQRLNQKTYILDSVTPANSSNLTFSYDYIDASLIFKYLSPLGLYGGVGISAKYMLKASVPDSTDGWALGKPKKKIDMWTNLVVGYVVPVSDNVVFNFESRFGWNVTKKQFEKWEESSSDYKIKRAYDFAFYAGVGYRMKFDPLKDMKNKK